MNEKTIVSGQKGGGCFPYDTKISMANGIVKNIQDIKIGDEILSFDSLGNLEADTIEEIFVHEDKDLIRMTYWAGTLTATPNHWVLNQFNAFVELGTLKVDDALTDANGHLRPIEIIQQLEETATVYNLTVSKNHTFIADNIRVHNGGNGYTKVEEFVSGEKGSGGKGGGGGSVGQAAVEAPNTLRSKATVKVVDVISEGEIVGLADGAKSIFFDETPVQNEDLTYNFGSLTWEERVGNPAGIQTPLAGFPDTENTTSVDTLITEDSGGIVRAITNINADAVRVALRLPSGLSNQSTTTSDLNGSTVSMAIDSRPVSGAGVWTEIRAFVIEGKTTNPYEVSYRIEKPTLATGAWDVRIRRITEDATTANIRDTVFWGTKTEITDLRMVYPDTALVGVSVDSELVGNRIPIRGYKVFGMKIQVPSNYTPRQYDKDGVITAEPIYDGIWNGTFQTLWSNNPAWVYYDMITNDRFGLGIDATLIDKFALYTIAQYCDELVDDGFGSQEPRFAFTGLLNTREEAYHLLQAIASAFRGMAYWSTGAVGATQDSPNTAVKLYTSANVLDGIFNYDGTSLKSRHSVVAVTWNDPADAFRTAIELVEDTELIDQFGYKQKDILAYGCISQGQAHRFGKWMLDTERYETEKVAFRASYDSADVLPGDIIDIADEFYAAVRMGGRTVGATLNNITIDDTFTIEPGESYTIQFVKIDGTLNPSVAITNIAGDYTAFDVTPNFDEVPLPGAVWVINATNVAPRQFRVISNRELEPNVYEINALEYDGTKYARVEQGIQLEIPQTSRFEENTITPVQNVTSALELHTLPEGLTWRLRISWEAPNIGFAKNYLVTYRRDSGDFVELPPTYGAEAFINDALPGEYEILIQAVSITNIQSIPITHYTTVTDESFSPLGKISGLQIEKQGNDAEFSGQDIVLNWRKNHPTSSYALGERYGADGGYLPDTFEGYQIKVSDTSGNLLRTDIKNNETYTYTYEMNIFDGGPRREVNFELKWLEKTGRLSSGKTLNAVNNPPAVLVINETLFVSTSFDSFILEYDRSTDSDYDSTSVWISTTPSFTPTNQELVYKGTDGRITISQLEELTTYYVRVMLHDKFDPNGGNISDEFEIATSSFFSSFSASSAGGGTQTMSDEVTFADANPIDGYFLGNIFNGRPTGCKIFVNEAWDTAATLTVGYLGKDTAGIMQSTEIDLTTTGSYESLPDIFNNDGGSVTVFINNNGSPTIGKCFVVVETITTT